MQSTYDIKNYFKDQMYFCLRGARARKHVLLIEQSYSNNYNLSAHKNSWRVKLLILFLCVLLQCVSYKYDDLIHTFTEYSKTNTKHSEYIPRGDEVAWKIWHHNNTKLFLRNYLCQIKWNPHFRNHNNTKRWRGLIHCKKRQLTKCIITIAQV